MLNLKSLPFIGNDQEIHDSRITSKGKLIKKKKDLKIHKISLEFSRDF